METFWSCESKEACAIINQATHLTEDQSMIAKLAACLCCKAIQVPSQLSKSISKSKI